jgi:hypothetical protein
MRTFARIAILSTASFAVVMAGATVDRSTVSVLGEPGSGGGCSASYDVGGLNVYGGTGTGGISSDQKARGFRTKFEAVTGPFPGATVTNQSNESTGHLSVSGTVAGTLSGAANEHNGGAGHTSGAFGDCSGRGCL